MASLVGGLHETTRLQVTVNNINAVQNNRYIIWFVDGDERATTYIPDGKTSFGPYYLSGLEPDTTYLVRVEICVDVGGIGAVQQEWDEDEFTTLADNERPKEFEWTYPKTAKEPFNLAAKEWNGLCDHVNELLLYYDEEEYDFTKAYRDDPFLADMYNEILDAIYPISPRSKSYLSRYEVQPKYPITAKSLNDLVDLVNEC